VSSWRDASIAGIGRTPYSKRSGRSNLELSIEAIRVALNDAGLQHDDLDGLVTSVVDTSDPSTVAESLGLDTIRYFAATPYGGGGICAAVQEAAAAVVTGAASVVAVYRGMNGRSQLRYGQGYGDVQSVPYMAYSSLYGNLTPAQQLSLNIRRYMHEFGVTSADFGAISVVSRKHASTNPDAYFYQQPITLEDHQSSRWIVEPVLHLLDCCMESDGGIALIVCSSERARDSPHGAIRLAAASQGLSGKARLMMNYYRDTVPRLPEIEIVGANLWRAGLKPSDIDVAILYDNFSPFVMMQLEALGFCGPGEAKDFVREGHIEIGGGLPVNTNGGMLGEAYIHGMNGILEAVRQLRGSAANQVADAHHVLVTAGPGTPASGIVLTNVDA
jgi:acetyl-CoA acetyltransferase